MPLLFLLLLLDWQGGTAAESTISGTAADSITGAALSKVRVVAEPANNHSAPFGTVTDEKGRFTLVHLPPGEYRLKGARNGYLPTYYGARQAGSKGITLSVEARGEQKDLRLKLLPFAVIAGTVRDPEGEALVEARVALIAVTYRNGIRQLRATGDYGTTDDLGQFRIPGVRPGHYYLKAAAEHDDDRPAPVDRSPEDAPAPQTPVPTFYPAARDPGSARKIDVAAGDRFTGADVTLLRSRLYRVRVKLEGPPGIPKGVGLHPRPELNDGLGPNPASDCDKGICEFTRVPNGSYSAVGSTGPRNPTMDEMFSNSSQTYVSVPVDVAGADVDGVVVAIGPPAEIDGHITGDRENVRVEFIDAEGDSHNGRFAADGSFTASLSAAVTRYGSVPAGT
ncbi:MAG: carboxypeptidase-like regulatory domain-containing protein [Candidatus Sulfopaludibacter sp.]|nr:carboxypeptidase-like regulatory domain-containing protein [Candidatus Sulfopaludibacter sp.]